jgi:hypothetical protein
VGGETALLACSVCELSVRAEAEGRLEDCFLGKIACWEPRKMERIECGHRRHAYCISESAAFNETVLNCAMQKRP